ncbi:MAG: lytic transglycosylase domain-containing protein [Burkholderiaceae bacterium]|jgi:soluble lytic murein transglycosylase-like protein
MAFFALAAMLLCCGAAKADCYDAAAQYHQVNPLILRAIAWAETHNQPTAVHKNDNGSTDYGLMQINSVHLPALSQYGVSEETLMQPCANVYVAAWHLRRQMNKYGNTWAAVGAYHSETAQLRDRYAARVMQILKSWGFLP